MLESAQCCASPPTTPGSVDDEELLPKKPPQDSIPIVNKIFYSQPFVILAISSLQVSNEMDLFKSLESFGGIAANSFVSEEDLLLKPFKPIKLLLSAFQLVSVILLDIFLFVVAQIPHEGLIEIRAGQSDANMAICHLHVGPHRLVPSHSKCDLAMPLCLSPRKAPETLENCYAIHRIRCYWSARSFLFQT